MRFGDQFSTGFSGGWDVGEAVLSYYILLKSYLFSNSRMTDGQRRSNCSFASAVVGAEGRDGDGVMRRRNSSLN